jgi:hypothetical protein
MLGNFETFQYRAQNWTRFFAPPADEAFIAGLDLGQSTPSSSCAITMSRCPTTGTWTRSDA